MHGDYSVMARTMTQKSLAVFIVQSLDLDGEIRSRDIIALRGSMMTSDLQWRCVKETSHCTTSGTKAP